MTSLKLPQGLQVFERGWLSSNNVFFDDGNLSWLVDSGYSSHSSQTLALVKSKLPLRSLNFLVNTHLHSDHCGGNLTLQRNYPDLKTLIPPGQAASVHTWDPVQLFYTPTGQLCDQFKFSDTLELDVDIKLGFQLWQVYSAGGHDPHAVIFFEPVDRVLISGDALWENGFGVVFPELDGVGAFDDVSSTLDVIERLNPKIVIPGHGPTFQYVPETLIRARKKLAAFVRDPVKHGRHAAKVLMKFKLLDAQKQSFSEFEEWAKNTECLLKYQTKFFGNIQFTTWLEQMCDELVASGVAKREGSYIRNN